MCASSVTPKLALQSWALQKQVLPREFAQAMGYTYNHSYRLLRGRAEMTVDVLGRFIIAFGVEEAQSLVDTSTALTHRSAPSSGIRQTARGR